MTVQADSSTLDLFRERLASPFIFTYFWVSLTWNWKLVYWFLYEPLKPSLKLNQIPFDWNYWQPFGITLLLVVIVPWLNNGVEFLKRFAVNWFNKWLHTKGWKEMISNDEHLQVLDELSKTKARAHDLTDKYDDLLIREKEVKERLIKEQEKNSKLLSDIATEKEQSSFYEIARNEIKEKQLEAEELHLKSHNEALKYAEQLKKSENEFKNLSHSYNKQDETLNQIKKENKELANILGVYSMVGANILSIPEIRRASQVVRNIDSLLNK
ncbi:hypothetical protein [Pseudoalteromonas sp. GB43]